MIELFFGVALAVIIAWLVGQRSRLRLRARVELVAVVLGILLAGAYVVAKRFAGGLGAVTALNDQFPWGLWITFDLCGVALAAGGFLVAGTVHLFHLRRFEPVLRPTILTSLIAYQLVAAVLVLDLGRPQRFWHPLILWQPHSVMFEITLCLSLYTVVLAGEFSPALFEKFGWSGPAATLRRLNLPLVLLGGILSTLHQSSFGSLFLIVPEKLHPLWYTPWLPVLFLVSAAAAGLAMVIVESALCARFLGRRLPPAILEDLGRACRVVLWVYLALRVGDVVWRQAWTAAGHPWWLGASFVVELVGGALLPALWLGRAAADGRPRPLVPAALLVIGGVVLHRVNISWWALLPATGASYAPTWMEWMVTLALVALGILAFLAVAAFLPVFAAGEDPPAPRTPLRV